MSFFEAFSLVCRINNGQLVFLAGLFIIMVCIELFDERIKSYRIVLLSYFICFGWLFAISYSVIKQNGIFDRKICESIGLKLENCDFSFYYDYRQNQIKSAFIILRDSDSYSQVNFDGKTPKFSTDKVWKTNQFLKLVLIKGMDLSVVETFYFLKNGGIQKKLEESSLKEVAHKFIDHDPEFNKQLLIPTTEINVKEDHFNEQGETYEL